MKKALLLFTFLWFNFSVNAQVGPLVQENWVATKVTINNVDYLPDNSIAHSFLNFIGGYIVMGVCDYNVSGEIEFIDNSKIHIKYGYATLAFSCQYLPFTDYYPDTIILTNDLLNQVLVELDYQATLVDNINNEYELTITNKNGDKAYYTNKPLSTGNLVIKNISIYPNPTQNEFSITADNHQIQKVNLYSLQGKLIKTFSDDISYIISEFNSGIYFAEIQTEIGTTVKKIIKK
ncbi:T9SS type A sorting domain-containing protein [Mesonia sp. K7]|uniref:T9SS type A sorting domain-containing protein n=1 Tax=Mesonia sp. K7 TaxID=2218606 RepID=UPI000DA7515C|nr:T9SS type A sorting domain-containing protein [Mesonia sp. K7]PZD77745.1 hypothetical protein DNG35_07870 [Mesonia sp. K7]